MSATALAYEGTVRGVSPTSEDLEAAVARGQDDTRSDFGSSYFAARLQDSLVFKHDTEVVNGVTGARACHVSATWKGIMIGAGVSDTVKVIRDDDIRLRILRRRAYLGLDRTVRPGEGRRRSPAHRRIACHSLPATGPVAVGLDTLLAGATVDCEAVMDEHGAEVSRILAVDFSSAAPGTASVVWTPPGQPAATSRHPDPSDRWVRGIVKWFLADKGYGFIEPGDGSADVFCHLSVVQASGHETLPQGAAVECETVDGARGLQASRILSVEPPTPGSVPARPRNETPHHRANGPFPAEILDLPGTVKFYNPVRGFGFIAPDRGGREVFVHASVLKRCGMADPLPGQRVLVRAESVPRGLAATDIEPL